MNKNMWEGLICLWIFYGLGIIFTPIPWILLATGYANFTIDRDFGFLVMLIVIGPLLILSTLRLHIRFLRE